MVGQVVEVQGVGVACCGEVLVDCDGGDGEVWFEVEAVGYSGDELVQGDVEAVAREEAVVCEGVDAGTGAADLGG